MSTQTQEKPVLIYDGECPMCLRARDWVSARTREGDLRLVPCQSTELPEVAPSVSYEQCMEAMRLVLPDGSIRVGEDAFEHLFPYIRGWGWARLAFKIPGARLLAKPVYRWVARHRLGISGFMRWKTSGESCSIDEGCE